MLRFPARHSLTGGVRLLAAALALSAAAAPVRAFDSKGHVVIEALVYRSLVEGHDARPPRPEVLRDLFNDGDLTPPLCFGWGENPPGYCADARIANPLLAWPRPLTDQPDAAFRRQFSDAGQCFHFMATLEDAESPAIPGTSVPRGLATSALVRCRGLLDDLMRQVVIDGGPGTRRSSYGLYELMHAVGDSFSGAHTGRRPGTHDIDELRVWKPLTRLPGLAPEAVAAIPDSAFHKWDDRRDKSYVVEDRTTAFGKRCGSLTDRPYAVPYECLSEEGDLARQAIVEMLLAVHDLREARLAGASAPVPEQSDAWRAWKEKWFAAAHPCRDAECAAKQPADVAPGSYGFLGLDTAYNGSRKFFDVAAKGTLMKYSVTLNPFVYALGAEVGYRHFTDGGGSGLVGLDLDLILPIGKRASLGFVPAAWRVAFGGERTGTELTTSFFRFDYLMTDRLSLTLRGPLEINWRRPAAEWSVGVGLSYALSAARLAGGSLIQRHEEKVDRRDETWVPPDAPYGRLGGRRQTWYAATGATTVESPSDAVEGVPYGGGSIGGTVMWDRDRWGGRFAWVPGASLALGARRMSGDNAYLTGTFDVSLRWYALRVLGLSLTPVRLEGGPKIRGDGELDPSPDVHGPLGGQYYFQAGSRLGLAFNAGIVDLLVEAPTLAWSGKPFAAHEILSVHLGIRLN